LCRWFHDSRRRRFFARASHDGTAAQIAFRCQKR
jgi:hypothetical protein